MQSKTKKSITVETTVNAPAEKVWQFWTQPEHIMKWCQASDDWHAPFAENDLRQGGKFKTVMASKDGAVRFDFEGVYDAVTEHQAIEYTLGDGRKVSVRFSPEGSGTRIVESFDHENINSEEMQRSGWQAILDNFKKYASTHA